MVIRALRRELGKQIEHVWVKGHQDEGVRYDQLGHLPVTMLTLTPSLHGFETTCLLHPNNTVSIFRGANLRFYPRLQNVIKHRGFDPISC